jgi:RNA polymerase sigma factor (sigma-70 family)
MATGQLNGVIQHLRRAVLLRDGAGLTDGQLLEDYISRRDQAALAALVQRHGPMVWGVCRRVLSNYHDAEDAFQATFLVLVRRAASIASPELLANWLYGVAHHTAMKARATVAKRKVRERQVTGMPEPAAVEQELWNDLRPLLDQELSRLSDVYRVVIVLCDLEGKTRKEAARHLGLPEGTVGSRLARARVLLAKRLTERGVTVSGGALAAVLSQNVASAGAPDSVVSNTIGAASLFAARQSAAVISPTVATLTEGVLKAMLVSKLKAVVTVALVLGLVATGATVLSLRTVAAQGEKRAVAEELPAALLSNGVPAAATGRASADEATIDGTWVIQSFVLAGQPVPDDVLKRLQATPLKVQAGKLTTPEGVDVVFDATKKPHEVVGTHPHFDGYHGIYKIDGDVLTVCRTSRDNPRPTSFSSTKENGWQLRVYKRSKNPPVEQKPDENRDKEGFTAWGKPVVIRQDAILQRMAMSPDGQMLATVGVTHDGSKYNSTVKLWDARTGKLKQALDEVKDSHLELAFSRDFLAIGVNGKLQDTDPRGPREVRLLDVKTLEVKHKIDETLVPGVRSWSALAFSPDGKRLAVAGGVEGAFVKLWDVEKQKLIEGKADLGEIPRELNEVGCLAFSPDGKVVAATWRDGNIRLFDGHTGDFTTLLDPELKPESRNHGITGIAFSPDSKTLASKGDDNTVVLWDLKEGKPGRTLKGHKGAVSAVTFSRDGRWIATGASTAKEDDYEVILWDAKAGEVKQTFPGLTEPVHVVAFAPDGKTLAVCAGGGRVEGPEIKKTSGAITLFPLE